MLTQEDINLLIKAEKEIFPAKDDFEDLRKDFRQLQTSVDNYSKKTDAYHQEMAVLNNKISRLEDWVKKAAGKLGIDFNL